MRRWEEGVVDAPGGQDAAASHPKAGERRSRTQEVLAGLRAQLFLLRQRRNSTGAFSGRASVGPRSERAPSGEEAGDAGACESKALAERERANDAVVSRFVGAAQADFDVSPRVESKRRRLNQPQQQEDVQPRRDVASAKCEASRAAAPRLAVSAGSRSSDYQEGHQRRRMHRRTGSAISPCGGSSHQLVPYQVSGKASAREAAECRRPRPVASPRTGKSGSPSVAGDWSSDADSQWSRSNFDGAASAISLQRMPRGVHGLRAPDRDACRSRAGTPVTAESKAYQQPPLAPRAGAGHSFETPRRLSPPWARGQLQVQRRAEGNAIETRMGATELTDLELGKVHGALDEMRHVLRAVAKGVVLASAKLEELDRRLVDAARYTVQPRDAAAAITNPSACGTNAFGADAFRRSASTQLPGMSQDVCLAWQHRVRQQSEHNSPRCSFQATVEDGAATRQPSTPPSKPAYLERSGHEPLKEPPVETGREAPQRGVTATSRVGEHGAKSTARKPPEPCQLSDARCAKLEERAKTMQEPVETASMPVASPRSGQRKESGASTAQAEVTTAPPESPLARPVDAPLQPGGPSNTSTARWQGSTQKAQAAPRVAAPRRHSIGPDSCHQQ